MSAPKMTNVEVILTVSYPIPADPEERFDIYGTSTIEECVQIDIDNDAVALFSEADLVNVQVTA